MTDRRGFLRGLAATSVAGAFVVRNPTVLGEESPIITLDNKLVLPSGGNLLLSDTEPSKLALADFVLDAWNLKVDQWIDQTPTIVDGRFATTNVPRGNFQLSGQVFSGITADEIIGVLKDHQFVRVHFEGLG